MPTPSSHPISPRLIAGITGILRRPGVSTALAAVAVAVVAASIAVPLPASAAEADPTWEVAAPDGPHGADRPNFRYSGDGGERIEDSVLVSNPSDQPVELELYAADAFTTDAGMLDIRTRSHVADGVGAWLTLATDHVALQAGEQAEVPFVITVPGDAAGEYLGGIVASAPGASAQTERRAAIRVGLNVGTSFHPGLSIEDVRVDYSGHSSETARRA